MPIKQMEEERGLDNHGNRIAYTGTNVIVLVQITRPLKEAHKHIPDAVLFIALGFVFQIIDCNEGSSLYFTGLLRFLYKGIIIKHNKTEPTYTKTSLFLCEKRRFFMGRTEKGGKVF